MFKNMPIYIRLEIHTIVMDILTAVSVAAMILIIQWIVAR